MRREPGGRPRRDVLDRLAAHAGIVLVIGASDTGKTTLVTELASTFAERHRRVGVVDADLGQSSIGPPTTVALGCVRAPLDRLGDAELIAMHFVGVTSPAANLTGALVGARRMVDHARGEGLGPIVVDTCGLVAGDIGRALKQATIDLIDPDVVVCLQRADECEPILRAYRQLSRPLIVRLPVSHAVRRRTVEERRRFRDERLRQCLTGATRAALDLTRVAILAPPLFMGSPLPADALARAGTAAGQPVVWAERRAAGIAIVTAEPITPALARQVGRAVGGAVVAHYAAADLIEALVGLEDAQRRILGVGVVKAIDFAAAQLLVESTVPAGQVAAVWIGREKYRG